MRPSLSEKQWSGSAANTFECRLWYCDSTCSGRGCASISSGRVELDWLRASSSFHGELSNVAAHAAMLGDTR